MTVRDIKIKSFYVASKGETFMSISRKIYNSSHPMYEKALLLFNKKYTGFDIPAGTRLRIPDVSDIQLLYSQDLLMQ